MDLSLNPMIFYARFTHISKKIFEKMDIKSLQNSREVSKLWLVCIDDLNVLWRKIAKTQDLNKTFQLAL